MVVGIYCVVKTISAEYALHGHRVKATRKAVRLGK
jgi:hypothetical protein